MTASGRIRVLIVDDSAVARDLLERGLSLDPELEVVGKASDAYAARDKIVLLRPDVMTLDVEMPRMDGIAFLRRLMPQYPIPAVVVSAVTAEGSRRAMDALEAGALGVVAKPGAGDPAGLRTMIGELSERIKEAAKADPEKLRPVPSRSADPGGTKPPARPPGRAPGPKAAGSAVRKVIAIGASTGGTAALAKVVTALPADAPPVLIVQHMPPVFTRMFAETLDKTSAVTVREARDGDTIEQGLVLVAPGDLHLRVVQNGLQWKVRCAGGDKVSGHRPSVDVLFDSVAEAAGSRATGLILTGMGADGAAGLLRMRRRGARCFAQDEESSVVFGMPGEAWKLGAAERLVPIGEMTRVLLDPGSAQPAGGRSVLSRSIP